MAILAGSLTNIYASLDQYLATTLLLPDGSPIALQLHGVRRFPKSGDDPWVEANYDFLALNSSFRNRVGLTGGGVPRLATERQGYLQLNCYQRARFFAQRYVTAAIRDSVIAAFPEGELIPTYDYSASTLDQDGWIVIDETTEHVADTGAHSGVIQHVIQVHMRYLEIYTRSV